MTTLFELDLTHATIREFSPSTCSCDQGTGGSDMDTRLVQLVLTTALSSFWMVLVSVFEQGAGGSDVDTRLVYVSTHAEGVTRVLCFSDTKDQYTREAHAEDAAGLTRRLAKLDAQLQVWFRSAVVALAMRHPAILCCVVWQRSGSCTSLCTYVSCLLLQVSDLVNE